MTSEDLINRSKSICANFALIMSPYPAIATSSHVFNVGHIASIEVFADADYAPRVKLYLSGNPTPMVLNGIESAEFIQFAAAGADAMRKQAQSSSAGLVVPKW